MVTAGNLYGKQGDKAVVDLTTKMATIGEEKGGAVEGISKNIKTYTLQYIDGRMENKIIKDKSLGYTIGMLPGFTTYVHKVHLSSFSDNTFISGMNTFINDIVKSIGANISGVPTTINYGTAAVSMAMANPVFSRNSVVGLDGTGFSGRITYESDNGEEKIIDEYEVLYLGDLFKKY